MNMFHQFFIFMNKYLIFLYILIPLWIIGTSFLRSFGCRIHENSLKIKLIYHSFSFNQGVIIRMHENSFMTRDIVTIGGINKRLIHNILTFYL